MNSRFSAVGVMPRCETTSSATCCGFEGGAPVGPLASDSIDSSIDMPRPSNRLATNTDTMATVLRPG